MGSGKLYDISQHFIHKMINWLVEKIIDNKNKSGSPVSLHIDVLFDVDVHLDDLKSKKWMN